MLLKLNVQLSMGAVHQRLRQSRSSITLAARDFLLTRGICYIAPFPWKFLPDLKLRSISLGIVHSSVG